jgi:PAS domain S-box-containing protein
MSSFDYSAPAELFEGLSHQVPPVRDGGRGTPFRGERSKCVCGHAEDDEPDLFGDARSLRLLINAVIYYAIYMIDLDGRVLTWNAGAVRLKGYSAEEITGQPFTRFYTPEDIRAELPQKALRAARETGRFEAEGWRVRKDGTRFWASVVIDAVRDPEGDVIGFAKVTRDITERRLAQEAMLESERRYRRLIEAVTDYAIFQLDPNGQVTT